MAQYIPLPDGTYLKLQEGESPSQGFQRAREKYPEAFATPAKPAPEPGIGGQIKEFGKGLVPGAVGLLESAAIGASSILPEDLEKSARAGIKSLAGAAKAPFAPSAGYEESVGRKLGEAVGSTVPFLAAGPFGLAGRIGAAGLGAGAGSGEARTRAEASGATDEQRSTATALGIIPGLAEIFAPFRILSRIPDAATATGVNMVKRALIAGGEEAAQEAASNWAQNLIAKGIYKPEQELIEGLGESAAYGGATGALIQGVMDLALGRRARGAAALKQQEEEQKKQAAALEQEEARKKTPEYLLQLNTDYEAAKVRQQELDKAAKKPGKDAPPDVWETYKQARDEANTHKNQTLIPLGKEVSKNKAAIAQLKERQRVEGLTQEQYLIETLGEKAPDTEVGVDTSFVDLAQTTAAAPAPAPENVYTYAESQIALAKEREQADTLDADTAIPLYAQYLLENPAMARELVKSKKRLPGMSRAESDDILGEVKDGLERLGVAIGTERETLTAEKAAEKEKADRLKAEFDALTRIKERPEFLTGVLRERQEIDKERAERAERSRRATSTVQEQRLLDFEGQQTEAAGAEAAPPVQETVSDLMLASLSPDQKSDTDTVLQKLNTLFGVGQKPTGIERTYVKNPTKETLSNLISVARTKGLPANDEALLDRIEDNFNAFTADTAAIEDATDYIYKKLLIGTPAEAGFLAEQQGIDPAKDIKDRLAAIETVKLSETAQKTQLGRRRLTPEEQAQLDSTQRISDVAGRAAPTISTATRMPSGEIERAVQTTLPFTDRRGEPTDLIATAFRNWREFKEFLSGSTLQQLRATNADVKNRSVPNVHRAQKFLQIYLDKADALSSSAAEISKYREKLLGTSKQDVEVAKGLLDKYTKDLRVVLNFYKPSVKVVADLKKAKTSLAAAEKARDALMQTLQQHVNDFKTITDVYEQAMQPVIAKEGEERALMLQYEAKGIARQDRSAERADVAREKLKTAIDNLVTEQRILAQASKALNFITPGTGSKLAVDVGTQKRYERSVEAEAKAREAVGAAYKEFVSFAQRALRVAAAPQISDKDFKNFLMEEARLTDLINAQNKTLQGLKLSAYNARMRLNDAYLAIENTPEVANLLQGIRQNLNSADALFKAVSAEFTERMEKAESDVLVETQKTLAKQASEARATAGRIGASLRILQKSTLPTSKTERQTQADREAQDAEARKAEQRELELMQGTAETVPREQILMEVRRKLEQKITDKVDKLAALREIAEDPESTLDERVEASNEFAKIYKDTHGALARRDQRISNAYKRHAAIVKRLTFIREELAKPSVLTEKTHKRYKNNPEKIEALENKKRTKYENQRTLGLAELARVTKYLSEGRGIERVQVPKKLGKPAIGSLPKREIDEVPSPTVERIAETQTTTRQVGPVTKLATVAPAQLRTESPESRAGISLTSTRNKLRETANKVKRNVKISKQEIAEANTLAEEMLSEISKTKTDLDAVVARLEFIKNNPAASAQGKQRQKDAKKDLNKQKAELTSRLGELRQTQNAALSLQDAIEGALGKRGVAKDEVVDDDDVNLSRGDTANPSTTDSVRAELKEQFPDLGRVQIYDSVDALIKANPQYEGKIPSDARGFVDTAGNKAFLIAENINQGQALSVLLHEVGVHIGMRETLGKQYNASINAVENWAKKDDGSLESRIAKAAQARVEKADTPASQQRDELIAYAAEEAVNAGVKPTETKSPIGRWLGQIMSMFRNALRKFGLASKDLTAQELVDMAYGAAKMEMTPKAPQLSRRQFLRGAGAALGALKLPPLSKEMNLSALRSVFEASLDARAAWFDAIKSAVKTKGLAKTVDQYEDLYEGNNPLVSFTQSDALQNFLYNTTYNENYQGDGYDYHLNELLSGKDGVKVVADLQQALRAQGASLVETVQKTAKEKVLPETGELFFSKKVDYAPGMEEVGKVASTLIGKPKTAWQSAKANLFGLNFRTQFVDALAPIEAVASQMKDSLKASQMMYYLRMYGQRMNFTSQAVERGAPVVREIKRKDGRIERIIEATDGANIKDIVALLSTKEVKAAAGSADAANQFFTLYLAAIRAKRVGMDALNFGGKVTEAKLNEVFNKIESDPVLKNAFGKARDLYNEYNRDLLKFAVQTGAISQDLAAKLLSENDYVPFYRVRDGVAELVIGTETPIRVGNLKDSPHLQELIGGDEAIFNFLDSSVQNTAMLIDMSVRNLAVKNSMFELSELGLVSNPVKAGKKGPPTGAITFKKDGIEYYVVPQKEKLEQYGVPSELLVKGLEGIPTMFPAFVRLFGVPSRFLRRVVVASPVYMARQLFRDSLASYIISGSNATPVFGALKQIGKVGPLEKRGITGGQVFTGMPEDVSRLLAEMQSGRPGWDKALTSLEALSMKADALSRRAQYESYIAQGMSEMEATLLSLESMNFSKRGVSPTVHMATTLIPFMNAQIQSLDVLYKAFSGKLPFNDKIAIRDKMLTRGLLLAAMSLAYAAGMEDDETYKNALPDQKYSNWFVKVPGLEEAVKVPIPFELGYIFKALPEALYNSMTQERGAAEAKEAFTNILRNLIPGGSSFFIPQAVKPLIEVGMGKSFFTGRDLETAQEQAQMPGTRYRDNTSEAAKFIGEMTNVSPVKLESLISGYTGSMGLALLQSLNMVLPTSAPDKATKRLSDMPVVGTLFQPKDAGGIINDTYKQLEEATQAQASYKALVNRGEFGKAQALLQTSLDEMSLNALATNYKSNMGKLTKAENMIRASSMSPDEKREALDRIRQAKIQIATAVRGVLEKRGLQASPA